MNLELSADQEALREAFARFLNEESSMARVRAVENRRWLLRDTNDGITVSVDPYGRIVARLAPVPCASIEQIVSGRTSFHAEV